MLVPLGLLLLADAGVTWWAARASAREAEERIRTQLARVTHTLTEPPTFPLTPRVLEQMKGFSGAEFVLVKRSGEPIKTFAETIAIPSIGQAELVVGAEAYRVERLNLPENHPNAGSVLLVCYPESARRTAVRDAVRPALISGVAMGFAALLLAFLGSRVVGRIRKLEQRTRSIAAGDFRPLPLPSKSDELDDLAGSVNEMANRLAEFQTALQQTERLRVLGQFSGGLAHQLRNAAAGAKLAVQLYLSEPYGADREPLEVALRQLARIESNLQQFLSLGKPNPAKLENVDWVELLDGAVKLLGPQCRHAGIELGWEKPASSVRPGDATLLGHLFGNLIGNAVEAAGPGGKVQVRWLDSTLEVSDTGPGPPSEIAERLFEPFVTGRDQGIGLGLAIAQQAADAQGGRITWERRDGMTVFRVGFPPSSN
jgi:signal transduction histidine kinase